MNNMPPRKKRRRVEPVANALATMFKRRNLTDLARFVLMNGAWEETVGKDLARHIQPAKYSRGTLFVTVRHSAWNTEIQFMAAQLMDSLNQVLGETVLTSIRVWAGAPFKPPPIPEPPRKLVLREEKQVIATGDCIQDPEVREAFNRLMRKWLSGEKSET